MQSSVHNLQHSPQVQLANIHDITLVKQSLILHSTNFKASFSLACVMHTAKTLVQSTNNSQNTVVINKLHKKSLTTVPNFWTQVSFVFKPRKLDTN